jgi:hypothetical protein
MTITSVREPHSSSGSSCKSAADAQAHGQDVVACEHNNSVRRLAHVRAYAHGPMQRKNRVFKSAHVDRPKGLVELGGALPRASDAVAGTAAAAASSSSSSNERKKAFHWEMQGEPSMIERGGT